MTGKSKLFNQSLNLIIEDRFEDSKTLLIKEYKNYPEDISLMHLLISVHIISGKKDEIIKLLRYEEEVSLYRSKLGFIRKVIADTPNLTLYKLGSKVLTRGWESDSNIYFRIHSLLAPDHDKSLIPLGETAIKSGQFQKGISLLGKAAENYFNNNKTRGIS